MLKVKVYQLEQTITCDSKEEADDIKEYEETCLGKMCVME